MKRLLLTCLVAIAVCCCGGTQTPPPAFVTIEDGKFVVDGQPYYFVGTNFWYGAILASTGEGGDRERLARELDNMHSLGIDNLRVLVGADGDCGVPSKVEPTLQTAPNVYNDTILDGLDWLLKEMSLRGMKAVLYLNNSWEWSGGYSQYLAWAKGEKAPVPSVDGWPAYMEYVQEFVRNDEAKAIFDTYVRDIVTRTNRYTDIKYTDDPAIFSWQIGNEPRAFSDDNKDLFAEWIGHTARLIRSLDANHLISTGSEGKHGCEQDIELCERIHAFPEISYINIHIWPYNWGWIAPETMAEQLEEAEANTEAYIAEHLAFAERLGKPVVIEEFGFPRDGFGFMLDTPTASRDAYYEYVFSLVEKSAAEGGLLAGCNFWGWGGEARPSTEHIYWQRGDDYCGDPAQEQQGLNSVFAGDTTVGIVGEANAALKAVER